MIKKAFVLVVSGGWVFLAFCIYCIVETSLPWDFESRQLFGVLGGVALIAASSFQFGRSLRVRMEEEIDEKGPYELNNLDGVIHQAYARIRSEREWLPSLREMEVDRLKPDSVPESNAEAFQKPEGAKNGKA